MTTKSLNQAFLRAFSKVENEKVPGDISGTEAAPTVSADLASATPVPDRHEAPEPGEVTCPGEPDPMKTEGSWINTLPEQTEPEQTEAGEILRIDGGRPSLPSTPTRRPAERPDEKNERMDGGGADYPETPFCEARPVPSPHFVAQQTPPLAAATQSGPSEPPSAEPPPVEPLSVETGASIEVEQEQGERPVGDPDHSHSDDGATPDESVETANRATWIISDLGHHARLLETMPLLVIPTGSEHDFSWSSDEVEVEIVDELPLCQRSGLRTSPLESNDHPGATLDIEEPETTAAMPAVEPEHGDGEGDEFISAWEVDHVGWTSVCQQLYDVETQPFDQAGQQLFSATAEGLRVLAITSAYRGEGRTTMSLLLARSAAAAGVRVAVLDADLDNPQLALNARVQPASDWRRTLIDQSPLEEAAIHAVREQITLFPLETQSRGEPLRLADPRVTKLIHDIAARFDLLIIDMGPIANDDRRLFAGGKVCPLDAAVVVRDLRYTTDEQTSAVVRRLMDLGVEAVGIAENFVREAASTVPIDRSVTTRSA